MRRSKKKYKRPKKRFDRERIEKEVEIMRKFGLKNKREIWKAENILRKFRRIARSLIAEKNEKGEKILINKLVKLKILEPNAKLDDILSLTVEDILKRRLQTIVYQKNLAKSIKHARQLIVHGKVLVKGRKSFYPSQLINKDEEEKIEVIE